MKRVILACIAAAALVPLTAEGTALAQGANLQEIGQGAGSEQVAASGATSTQVKPSNENISVRIGSPGNDGDVTQINQSAAASAAGNENQTTQAAGQSGAAQQAIGQGASNAQAALSKAKSVQVAPSNENISVRIHSPGDSGDVKQVNASSAQSAAGNENRTTQAAGQQAGSGGSAPAAAKERETQRPEGDTAPQKADSCASSCGGRKPTVQAIGQDAASKQIAGSAAVSFQDHPVNANHGSRSGDVDQVNQSVAKSVAGNANWTDQAAEQSAGGGGERTGTVVQAIGQSVKNHQFALSKAISAQFHPVNLNAPLTVPSRPKPYEKPYEQPSTKPFPKHEGKPYDTAVAAAAPAPKPAGDVRQANASAGYSAAGNENGTRQSAGQFAGRWPDLM